MKLYQLSDQSTTLYEVTFYEIKHYDTGTFYEITYC